MSLLSLIVNHHIHYCRLIPKFDSAIIIEYSNSTNLYRDLFNHDWNWLSHNLSRCLVYYVLENIDLTKYAFIEFFSDNKSRLLLHNIKGKFHAGYEINIDHLQHEIMIMSIFAIALFNTIVLILYIKLKI